jgi:hypothetical protein
MDERVHECKESTNVYYSISAWLIPALKASIKLVLLDKTYVGINSKNETQIFTFFVNFQTLQKHQAIKLTLKEIMAYCNREYSKV